MFSFKKKYTKWMPIASYVDSCQIYVVFARKNLNDGIVQFRTKKMNSATIGTSELFRNYPNIDTNKEWQKLLEITQ